MTTILSIQSHVAYGHVGNASAVFPLQRLGARVWPIHTTQFSNHPGYGAWRGRAYDGASVTELMTGIAERGVLERCDALLSGYFGEVDVGEAILDAVARLKAANPGAVWCCDPVIGDVGRGVYVRPGIPEFFRDRALATADIVTPNAFELEFLTGIAPSTLAEAKRGIMAIQARGPRCVLVTSLRVDDTPGEAIDMLAATDDDFFRLRTPLLPLSVNGAGDLIAALFLFHLLRRQAVGRALELAASGLYGVLVMTAAESSRELMTVAAQGELVAPTRRFTASRC
jgi:pyridoxine kinase